MAKVYAVKKGHKTGIFYSWPECQESIKGYSGAEFKSFPTEDDAIAYLGGFVDEKPMSNVIECKRDKECNIFVIGSFDNTKQIGGFGIRLESLRMKQDYYIGVLPNEEKGSVIYSEVLGSLVALQLAKELGYKVIRLYANNEGIVKMLRKDYNVGESVYEK